MYYFWWLQCVLHLLVWGSTLQTIQAIPPQAPVQCNGTICTLYNSYGAWGDRKDCHVKTVAYPTTEEELRLAVAHANRNKLRVKVVSKFSHTIPKLACPSTQQSDDSLLISTAKYDSHIEIDSANFAVTADGGVALRKLIDKVEEAGLSLVAAPYWEGVSVAGLISTGAHGSSWWGKGGAVHDHVIGLSLIVPASESEGYAKVIQIGAQDQLLNAAKVSLGTLGVISKVTFSLERGFKRSIKYNFTDDSLIENEFIEHGKKYEFGDIAWYPSKHTAVYRYDNRVSMDALGDGINDFLGFQDNEILVSESVRATEKALESAKNVNGKCILAATTLAYKKQIANGLKNNGLIFTGYPVVGRQGKMQTSGSCLYSPTIRIDSSCPWDPRIKGLFFYESTAIFSVTKFGDFIRDVKKLRDLKPENFCGVDHYNGFLIRYIKASQAYLGQSEDSIVVDFNYYRADDASTPRLNEDVMEEVEQMAFFKYRARPHWAKNRNLAFFNVQSKYPNYNKFLSVKKRLDPKNIFSSEWSDEILFGTGVKSDGCALEGLCICSEDRHCSPSKAYFCKPGLVYNEARVCRYSPATVL
ncbi:L-gulonolactone oxidase 3-like isoform X1 [Durio zibethinus]|uniref:L-gulonolactone oxidase n=1 Tax=Durio zibethinus TaxID=66656 RepID=A0A6P5XMX3_DURZI|nr:L-gulonolactone oxidase 3-like isoform X1 [Durio zibethinus]